MVHAFHSIRLVLQGNGTGCQVRLRPKVYQPNCAGRWERLQTLGMMIGERRCAPLALGPAAWFMTDYGVTNG
jgi:hypothetical protein